MSQLTLYRLSLQRIGKEINAFNDSIKRSSSVEQGRNSGQSVSSERSPFEIFIETKRGLQIFLTQNPRFSRLLIQMMVDKI